ncbi:uncharacterized protein [Pyxicephalus adspersus]|uniref:uncharacterized protein isoform X2 n=1 Tax=Pyxicephalus adspersus TaxID=30357 RepID=UPI003B5CDEB6
MMLEKVNSEINRNILQLALEIIYLLTGESYRVKKTDDAHMTPRNEPHILEGCDWNESLSTESPCLISEKNHNKKVLEVTQKIIKLLTGEVPVRCQDVTVYFSLEEWEYLEGHKDLYKKAMIEDHQTLTSLDGSRNTPESCPRPLYSQNSIKKHQAPKGEGLVIVKVEVEEEPYVRGDNRDPGDTRDTQRNVKVEHVRIKQEDVPIELGPDKDLTSEAMVKTPAALNHHPVIGDPSLCLFRLRDSSPDYAPSTSSHESPRVVDTFQCSVCSKCFKTKTKLFKHQRTHSAKKPIFCSECGKYFAHQSSFVRHKRLHTREKPFSCSKCGKDFVNKTQLASHEETHVSEYACSECGKHFSRKASLFLHKRVHTGEKPYACSECGKCFSRKSSFNRHRRIHTGEKPYSCAKCGKCFTNKSQLVYHEDSHQNEQLLPCSECGRFFTNRANLITHQKTHTGVKPHLCSECGLNFTRRGLLISHQRTHTGEKPYSCSVCGQCFSWKSQLTTHESLHAGKKPHSCPECGKCFSRKSSFMRHKTIHTGEKPYSCSECGKRFTNKSQLVSHKRRHWVEQTLPCSEHLVYY